MGLAIPRPAIRSRETRVIQARLRHYSEVKLAVMAAGTTEKEADKIAYHEARHLQFNRKGEIKN